MSFVRTAAVTVLVASAAACALGSNEADGDTLFSEPVPGSAKPGSPSDGPGSGPGASPTASASFADAGDGGSHQGARAAADASSDGGVADDSGAHESGAIAWTDTAVAYRCRRLERFAFACPAASASAYAPVYGNGIYTDDSSICTAAVHDGKIGPSGGRVIIEMRPGERHYWANTRNGVTTNAYDLADTAAPWPCSFVTYPW